MPIYKVTSPSVVNGNSSKHPSMVTCGGTRVAAAAATDDHSSGNGCCGGGGDNSDDHSASSNLAEMTEADRDSELLRRDLEQRVQLSQGDHHHKRMSDASAQVVHAKCYSSSIRRHTNGAIEEELLAQYKREEELASTRQLVYGNDQHLSSTTTESSTFPVDFVDHREVVEAKYSHPSEGRIAQEFMEQRRKELELRGRWKEMGLPVSEEQNENETPFTLPEPLPVRETKPSSRNGDHIGCPARTESSNEVLTKVRPYECPDDEEERKPVYKPANETPIEREIRLAGERENALRHSRGLEPLGASNRGPESRNVEVEITSPNGSYYHPHVDDPNVKESMKKLANNRLQLEMLKEKEREMALKSQGFINTISEERTGEPVKYVEVISKQLADASPPLFLKTTPGPGHHNTNPPETVKPVAETKAVEPPSSGTGGKTKQCQVPGLAPEQINELETVFGGLQKQQPMMTLRQKSSTSKPTAAERKILSELVEMQMREEELKSQRQSIMVNASTTESYDDE